MQSKKPWRERIKHSILPRNGTSIRYSFECFTPSSRFAPEPIRSPIAQTTKPQQTKMTFGQLRGRPSMNNPSHPKVQVVINSPRYPAHVLFGDSFFEKNGRFFPNKRPKKSPPASEAIMSPRHKTYCCQLRCLKNTKQAASSRNIAMKPSKYRNSFVCWPSVCTLVVSSSITAISSAAIRIQRSGSASQIIEETKMIAQMINVSKVAFWTVNSFNSFIHNHTLSLIRNNNYILYQENA